MCVLTLRPPAPASDNTVRELLLIAPPHAHHINVLLPLGAPHQAHQGDVVDQGGVVEVGVDLDVGDVELLVGEGLGRGGHVVLAQTHLQDLLDAGDEGNAARKTY